MQLDREQREAFGDPRFTSADLLPTVESTRSLDTRPAFALWSVLVLHPVVVDFAVARSALELRTVLPIVTGAAVVSLMGFALLRTPQRYGLGFAATARAAFGARGTHVVVVARWIATVLWCGAWVGYGADWATRLVLGIVRRFAEAQWTMRIALWRDPIALAVATVLVLLALRASRTSVHDQAERAPRRIALALVLALVLVALALLQAGGVPALDLSLARWSVEQWATESLTIALATLPPLLAFTEWARQRLRGGIDPETGRRLGRRVRASAPFVLIPVAGVFAGLGAVIHAAGASVSGTAPRGLVASASAFGGALGGTAAVLLGLLLFFSLVPFVGVGAPLRALASIWPGSNDTRLRLLTAVAIIAAAPLVRVFAPSALMVVAGVVLVPIAVVLIVDDGIIRRGQLQLEELYHAPSRYGPILGVGLAGLLALFAGWWVMAGRWDGVRWLGLPNDIRGWVNGFSYGGGSSVVILAGAAVAVVYGVVRILEGFLPLLPGRSFRSPGPERLEATPSSIDLSVTDAPRDWSPPAPTVDEEMAATGPIDPTVVDFSDARYSSVGAGDDEWPDEGSRGSLSEAAWFDEGEDASNPSVTEAGDPRFVKKSDDDG